MHVRRSFDFPSNEHGRHEYKFNDEHYGSIAYSSLLKHEVLRSLSAAVLFFCASLATPVHDRRASDLKARQTDCADPNTAVALLYAVKPTTDDHLYTTNATEVEDFAANDGCIAGGHQRLRLAHPARCDGPALPHVQPRPGRPLLHDIGKRAGGRGVA